MTAKSREESRSRGLRSNWLMEIRAERNTCSLLIANKVEEVGNRERERDVNESVA